MIDVHGWLTNGAKSPSENKNPPILWGEAMGSVQQNAMLRLRPPIRRRRPARATVGFASTTRGGRRVHADARLGPEADVVKAWMGSHPLASEQKARFSTREAPFSAGPSATYKGPYVHLSAPPG
jgi:hypothetical protein